MKKSMTLSHNTIQAEGLADFFRNLGKSSVEVGKKLTKNVLKHPGRAPEIGANVGSAFASRSPKTTLSSIPEFIKFFHTGKGLYLGKIA